MASSVCFIFDVEYKRLVWQATPSKIGLERPAVCLVPFPLIHGEPYFMYIAYTLKISSCCFGKITHK